MARRTSLTMRITLWAGGLTILIFSVIIACTSLNFRDQLQKTIYHDLLSRNIGYAQTIHSVFKGREAGILALRDDLELYETPGQIWVHLAAHTQDRVFHDPLNGAAYSESFHRKLDYYRRNEQLSDEKLTPQLEKMLSEILFGRNAYGDGMKYFYVGVPLTPADPVARQYDQYQDSSLWVPDPDLDGTYDPFSRPWYRAGRKAGRDRVVFTEPYAERRTGEAVVAAGTSITVQGIEGTLAGAISIRPIMERLLESFVDDAHITILSQGAHDRVTGIQTPPKYIYSSRDATLGETFRAFNDADTLGETANMDLKNLYEATSNRQSGVLEWTIDGSKQLVAFHTVPDVGWKIFTSVSQEQTMKDALSAQTHNVWISLFGLIVLLGVIYIVTKQALRPLETMQYELVDIAHTGDLSKRISVVSNNEVGQMANALNEMLDNTAGPVRELGLQVKQIAAGNLNGTSRIAAKGDIAQLVNSFNRMSERLIEFEQASRDASPLTGLPGGVSIEREIQNRTERGEAFTFCMFDLDHFKPFNDRYGYSRGNLVIKQTAQLIRDALQTYGTSADFCGHIGGDDFIVIASPGRFEAICRSIILAFDAMIPGFYDPEDSQSGGIVSKDRQGVERSFPIMTITICAVSSSVSDVTDFIGIGEMAAELKCYGKTMTGSNLIIDRRQTSSDTGPEHWAVYSSGSGKLRSGS